jgi:hypothetical protein
MKGFFAYFRWYSPTNTFFARSWKTGNILDIKEKLILARLTVKS